MGEVAVELDEQVAARPDARKRLLAAREHELPADHVVRDLDVEHRHRERHDDVLAVAAEAAVDVRIDARPVLQLQRVQVERIAVVAQHAPHVAFEERERRDRAFDSVASERDRESSRAHEVAVQVVLHEEPARPYLLGERDEVVLAERLRGLAVRGDG